MGKAIHATDFRRAAKKHAAEAAGFAVVFGDEHTLKRAVRDELARRLVGDSDEERELGVVEFAGKGAEWPRLADELRSVSMFSSHRLVVVTAADDFVSAHRHQLETYSEKPSSAATLLLDVSKWPKNTRLAKRLAESGLTVECSALSGARLTKYLSARAKDEYEKTLSGEAANLMVTLAGTSLGLLEQELDKLAAYVGDHPIIEPEDVRALVGGWKTETTWAMLDAVRDRRLPDALTHLDALLTAGEAPQKILGGVGFVYRKIAAGVERSRSGTPLPVALKDSGVRPFEVKQVEAYLRRIGRARAEQFWVLLEQADLGLKGGSQLPDRTQMERLLVQLSGA